ncbi:MAG: PPC domain-containing protein [Planctomycetaceae bacterium]|nr:PPC domain-containing protein [Planctomycetaceae bacterium]
MRHVLRLLGTAAVFVIAASMAQAEIPSIKAITPAGGQRGQTVEITVQGVLGTPPLKFWSNRPELTASFPEKPEKTFSITIPDSIPPGLALFRITNAESASSLRPFLIGTFPELSETEENERLTAAQKIESTPVTVNGTLGKNGDVDTYQLELEQGQTLVAEISANRNLGSPLDAVLQVVSAKGFVLAQNDDDRGNDPLLAFEVPETGIYYVRTFGFPETPNSSIRFSGGADWIYRLTITTGPYIDHIQPLAVTQGTETSGEAVGWNLPTTSVKIPALVTEGSTNFLAVPTTNVVPLSVVSHPVLTESEAPETITSLPVTLSGQIVEPGEVDAFQIAGKKGNPLFLKAEARILGSQLDPVLRLTDSDGKELSEVDDPTRGEYDSELTYSPKADGPLIVEIRDRFEHGSPRHYYRLTISPQEVGYATEVTEDHYEFPAEDKPLEIPVTVIRDKGFGEPITFSVEGLPDGVTAEAVTSEPKGDSSKKVTLKLVRGEIESFSSAIQIVAVSQGEAALATSATTQIKPTMEKVDQIWLTVPPLKSTAKKESE